jgi:hypothetical protein
VGAGSQCCDLILLGMELDNELTDPSLCILQITGGKLSLELIDLLLGLLEMVPRHAQFVLWRQAV